MPSRAAKAGRSRRAHWSATAAELSSGGQARRDHGRPLYPCPPVQSGAARTQVPAHSARSGDPRYPPQDRRQRDAEGALRPSSRLAVRVRFQDHRQRGPKVYSLHAPEVECIGKGKARAPYEFGCKVSIATPATKPKGGQFVLHAKALHGNPFDGHTLGPVITELEQQTGVRPAASMSTRVIAATITKRSSASGSAARFGGIPNPFAARCGGVPPSNQSLAMPRPSTVWAAII